MISLVKELFVMEDYMKKSLIVFCILVNIIPNIFAAGENPGELLDLSLPAEYTAKGKTFAAYSEGINASWANPAGIGITSSAQYTISGLKWLMDINVIHGGLLIPFNTSGNFAVNFGYLGSPEEDMELSNGQYDSSRKLNYNNMFFSMGYGKQLKGNSFLLPLGIGFKFVNSFVGLEKRFFILSDIGTIIRFNLFKLFQSTEKNFSIGVVVRNIELNNLKNTISEIRTGINYGLLSYNIFSMNLSTDVWGYSSKNINLGVGSQIWLYDLIHFAVGYNTASEDKITFGSGLKFNLKTWNLRIDYSMNPALSTGLPITHWIQLKLISREI